MILSVGLKSSHRPLGYTAVWSMVDMTHWEFHLMSELVHWYKLHQPEAEVLLDRSGATWCVAIEVTIEGHVFSSDFSVYTGGDSAEFCLDVMRVVYNCLATSES